jgi:hypothetical protein
MVNSRPEAGERVMGFLRRAGQWIVSARRRQIAWLAASKWRYILIAGGLWGGFMFACKALSQGAHMTLAAVLLAIFLYGAGGLLFGAFMWSQEQKRLHKKQALAAQPSH